MDIPLGKGEFRSCWFRFRATEKCTINRSLGVGEVNTKQVPIHMRQVPYVEVFGDGC